MFKVFPIEVKKLGHGKAEYVYDISQADWDKLKQNFDKSEFIEYGNCLDAVKDLAY